MPVPDFQVQISKDGTLNIVKPDDGSTLASIPFAGTIAKGCSTGGTTPLGLVGHGPPGLIRAFDTHYSFGHFSSPNIPGIVNMQQNPKYPDSGYEIEDAPRQEYPRTQFWHMFGIFTMDLSGLDPKFAMFQVANRLDNPIRLKTRLLAPWGTQSLKYELLDDQIPLYPWDTKSFDFATTCPFTGGAASPVAYIQKNGDQTEMVRAWTKVQGTLTQTL